MLSFMTETQSVWEILQTKTKPIVLYGMGNGADRILDRCQAEGIKIAGVFASDAFVRGQSFRGYTVHTYAELVAELGEELIVLIAFASESPQLLAYFRELEAKHEVYAPHVPLFAGDEVVSREWLERYAQELQTVYERLADDFSRRVFAAILNSKLSGKLSYLWPITTERYADLQTLLQWGVADAYVDLGAYDGDTIQEFLSLTAGQYHRIYAVEPDAKNWKKLERFAAQEQLPGLTLVHKGIWEQEGSYSFCQRGGRMSALAADGPDQVEVTTVDHLLHKREASAVTASYLKLDVEGVEAEALRGAALTLKADQPQLLVACYHHDNDLWALPLLLWSLQPNYRLYLRKHPYVPCWEINILAR